MQQIGFVLWRVCQGGHQQTGDKDTHLDSCTLGQGPLFAEAEVNFLGDSGGWEGGVGGLSPLPGPREGSLGCGS